LEDPRRHHALRSPRNPFFSWLENAPNRAFPFGPGFLEQLHGPQQTGGVDVVATGVHDAWACGGVRHLIGLLNGQCIHVRPQGHKPGSRFLATNMGHNACACHASGVLNAPFMQGAGDKSHGLMLLKREFWMGMQMASQSHPLWVKCFRQVVKSIA
jgi:hypothetical protein